MNQPNPQGGSNQPPGQPKPNIFGQNMPNPFTSPPLNPVPLNPTQQKPLPPTPNAALFSNPTNNLFARPAGQSNGSTNEASTTGGASGPTQPKNIFATATTNLSSQASQQQGNSGIQNPNPSANIFTNKAAEGVATVQLFPAQPQTQQPIQPLQQAQTTQSAQPIQTTFPAQQSQPAAPSVNVFAQAAQNPPKEAQPVQNGPNKPLEPAAPPPQRPLTTLNAPSQTQPAVQNQPKPPAPPQPQAQAPKPQPVANLFTNSNATTPTTAQIVTQPRPQTQPPAQPQQQTASSQTFPQSLPISELVNYLSSEHLLEAVLSGSSLSPVDNAKLLQNLRFYNKNDARQRYYQTKIEPQTNFFSNFFKLAKSASLFQTTVFKELVKYVSHSLNTDKLMGFFLVTSELPTSSLSPLLSDRIVDLRHLIFQYNQKVILNDNTADIKAFMIGVVGRWVAERRNILKAVELAIKENFIGNRLLAAGLKVQLWESYKALGGTGYRLAGETGYQLSGELSQSIIKEEFTISKLLYKACVNYQRLAKKDLPIKEIVTLFDEQRLQGSSLKLGIGGGTIELISVQQHLLLEILPIKPAVDRMQGQNTNNAWDAGLYNSILNTKSDPILPFRQVLPSIKQLYNLTAVALPEQNTIRKLEATVHGSAWDSWLELWLYKKSVHDTDEVWFALNLAKKVFKDKAEQLWNGHGYPNLRAFWADLFKRRDIPAAFELSTAMIGTQDNSYVQPTLESISEISSNIIHRQIFMPLKQVLKQKSRYTMVSQVREKGTYFESPIRFLCKCISSGPHCIEFIEQMLLNGNFNEQYPTSSGCYLILFLLDCIAHFTIISNIRIAKNLIKAITSLIKNKSTLKRVAICIACFSFELNSLSELITSLRIRSNQQTKDQVKLTKALLNNLIAILQVEYFDRYFITSDCNIVRLDDQVKGDIKRLSDRYYGKYDFQAMTRLCESQIPSSKWLLQLLEALALPPTSRTLFASNLLLNRLAPKHRDIPESQVRLLERFVDISNQIYLQKFIIASLNVRSCTNPHSLFNLQNRLWAESDQSLAKNRAQVARCLSNCLFVISTALTLVHNKTEGSPSVRTLIQQLQLVSFVERSLTNESKIYEYSNEQKTEDGWKCIKVNLPTAIASLLAFSYDGEAVEQNIPQTLYFSRESDITQEIKQIITSIDFKIVNNRLRQPLYRYYAGYLNVPISALRLMTKLMFFWNGIPHVIKPSLFGSLGKKSGGFSQDPGRSPQVIQGMMKCLLRKLLQQVQQKSSNNQQIISILDFFCASLQMDNRLFQVIFYHIAMTDSLSRLLETFYSRVFSKKWSKSNIMVVHKSLYLVHLLLKKSQTSDFYKTQCISLLSKTCYLPLKMIQSAPAAEHFVPDINISTFPISNVLKQRDLIWHTLYNYSIGYACNIVTWTIINNFNQISTYIREICTILYSARTAQEMFSIIRASIKIQREIQRYNRPYATCEELESNTNQTKVLMNSQVIKYGYGRNFNCDSLEFYDMIRKDQMTLDQINFKIDTLHRWNCLRGCEEAKQYSIEAWGCLFQILSGTGKEGFAFSGKLNTFLAEGKSKSIQLRQVKPHFGSRFMLLNSEQFVLNQGFINMVSTQMGYDMLIKFTYELFKIFFKRDQTEDDRDYENSIIKKALLLNSSLWAIIKVKQDSTDLAYLKQIWGHLSTIIYELMAKHRQIFERFQISAFFAVAAMICAKLRLVEPRLCQFAIKSPDSITKNILLASTTPLINTDTLSPESNQLLISWTLNAILKSELVMFDFTIGMNILTHLCVTNKPLPLLLSCQFFDKLRSSQLFSNIRDMGILNHRHAYLWLLRLFVVALTYHGDPRLQNQVLNTLSLIEETVLTSLIIRSGVENRRQKWKATSAQLNQSCFLMQIFQLLKSDSKWIRKIVPTIIEGSGFAWMSHLAGFVPNNVEKKLLQVKVQGNNTNRGGLTFKKMYQMEPQQAIPLDNRTDLFTFSCQLDLLDALQSYLQLLCQYSSLISPHTHWHQLQYALTSIQRYLLEHLTTVLSSVPQRTALLSCYNAFIDCTQQSTTSGFTYQFKSTLTFQDYVAKLGAVLYAYFETSMKLLAEVEKANQVKDAEVQVRGFKKQLESAVVKTADRLKFREPDILGLLGLDCPPERLWADVRNQIRSKM